MNKKVKHILLYGLALAVLIFGLKWLEWKFLIVDNAIDIYVGLIAVLFTVLGAWLATQLIKPKPQIGSSHEPSNNDFVLNQAELDKLNLTSREYEVLQLLVQGHSNADIAEKLYLSLSTIKTHVSNLYIKMHVKSRFEAITAAKRMEIVE